MKSKTYVVAVGGNALGKNPTEQLSLTKKTAKSIVDIIEKGVNVVLTHGNGPQVGVIKVATDVSAKVDQTPSFPFAECGAMSQGYIGYHLQQSIENELTARKINKPVASIITQTVVDKSDAAFDNPTKPVGSFYTEAEATELKEKNGFTYVEDAGRGWRRVVPSPIPKHIVEGQAIATLVNSGVVVISSGGGGIPVEDTTDGYTGVDAVIDKDRTAAILAEQIDADMLIILTAVDQVAIKFNTPEQKTISKMTIAQAQQYIDDNEFAPGSMLPKIEACINFVKAKPESKALITSLEKAGDALEGKTGTTIIYE